MSMFVLARKIDDVAQGIENITRDEVDHKGGFVFRFSLSLSYQAMVTCPI